jgi:CRISPR-associated exonuclease Cas4
MGIMKPTGTHFNYYHICHRKLWLFANGITMEHNSELVAQGKLIHESTYQNRSDRYREVAIGGIKVDYYDPVKKLIREVKKSPKMEDAHAWQLKYYIYTLEKAGIAGVAGLLEYPKLRQTEEVVLTDDDRTIIPEILESIEGITEQQYAPERKNISSCRNCSYFDFCWTVEEEI